MPRILKNLRIDEVSAVLKGAGVGTKVVIMKRAADDDDVYKTDWYRQQAAEAERQNREHARSARTFNEVLAENAAKSFDETPVDGDGDGGSADGATDGAVAADDHHASKVADLLVEAGTASDRRTALAWLFHNREGAALLSRLRKSHQEESTAMSKTVEELEAERAEKLRAVVKAHGIVAVCKQIIADGSGYGIDEAEFTRLATEHAQRVFPGDRPDVAFAKMFSANTEDGAALRQAHSIIKTAYAAPVFDVKPIFVGGEAARDVNNAT